MSMNNESKIGVLVAVVLLILAVLTWKTGNFSFIPDGYPLKVRFADVQGLEKNAPVTLNGYEEGRVKDIHVVYDDVPQIELSLWLKSEAKISSNAKASIRTMGFMGEKYVAIEMKDSKEGFLAPGALIKGEEPASLEKLLVTSTTMMNNLKEITDDINVHLKDNHAKIDNLIVNLSSTSENLHSITSNIDERLAINGGHIDDMIQNFDDTSVNLNEMSYDLKLNPWKLLFKAKEKKAMLPKPEFKEMDVK